MKRAGIVGYGNIGPVHAAALEKVQNAKLYAVCDVDPAKLEICRRTYDVVTYTDYDTMLLNDEIDCIHICTPHYLHFEMIKKALAAGKYVVCEKPVTMKKGEFDELLSLEHADRVCVVFQNRLNPCILKLKELAEGGKLGNIRAVRGNVAWYRTPEYYQDAWHGRKEKEGGGVLINQAIHTLDYFSYIVGDVCSVRAQKANFSLEGTIEVEDTVSAYVEFADGSRGVFFATNAYGTDADPEFEVLFDNSTTSYRNKKLYLNDDVIAQDGCAFVGKSYWGNSHETLIGDFYDANTYFTPKDVKNTMYAMFAMYESAENGSRKVIL